jgi:hypothetical protein
MTICKEKDCIKQCAFNLPGLKAKYCSSHKTNDMVEVNNKKCNQENCNKRPSYNFKNEKKGNFCFKHKKTDMINVNEKRKCKLCNKRPNYNIEGKKPLYCVNHKLENMVDVNNRKCKFENCNTQPSFNYENEKNGLYCYKHKLENMIEIYNTKCKEKNCNTRPNFNYKIEKKGLYCSEHKLENMVDVFNIKCKFENCNTRPTFNYNTEKKGLFCVEHKNKDMVDVLSIKCLSEFCDIIENKKYDNYCTHCFANLFPNDPRTPLIQKNSKEIKVVSFITNKREGWYHDKPLYVDLEGGCCVSKRRIDLRKLVNGTLLCIEIDENQHKYYDKQDQEDRYNNLFTDFSGKYIFIRYNPDKYKCGNQRRNPNFVTRMERLEEEIEKQKLRIVNDKNKDLVEIIKLFYDK